ncbi:DUF4184 family protein [Cesiribacter andamanensis]|uniref:DUF4184 family protein n=1 Tax=Cesiribacter andamanensis AMV16 TaxID=1279009 RepID=M7N0S0_9BACT|nr:DUF4184 family protein [Cesiribacter andamanensis]EMR00796.1 hypothetical protein ADICEAN_04081 [Cesiribacter andamanensis AMV16]
MPFTLSHPLGALPLKWLSPRLFSTTGLIFGSMAPDYEYFIKRYPSPTLGELGWGIFLFDLPLAILGAFVFQLLIKQPLLQHLPHPLDRRLSGYAQAPFLSYLGRHWLIFLFSILLGIGSHLLLDWLTNPGVGPLAGTVLTTATIGIGPFSATPLLLADHAFSILGLLLLVGIVVRLHRPSADFRQASRGRKWVYWGLLVATAAFLVATEWQQADGFEGFKKGVTTGVWALFAGLVGASVFIRLILRTKAS